MYIHKKLNLMDSHACETGKRYNNALGEGEDAHPPLREKVVSCEQPENLQPKLNVWLKNWTNLGKMNRCFFVDIFPMLFRCYFDVVSMFFQCFGAKDRFYIDFTSRSHRIGVKSRSTTRSPISNPGRLFTDFTLFSHRFHIARSPRFFWF